MKDNKDKEKLKPKNNKLSLMFFCIGLFLIASGIVLSIFSSPSSNKNKEEDKDNGNEIDNDKDKDKKGNSIHDLKDGEIDINNEEVKKYFEMYRYINYEDDVLLNELKDSNTYKASLSSRLLKDDDYENIQCNSINESTVDVEESVCGEEYLKEIWLKSTTSTKSIKKEKINKYYKYYFGEDKEIDTKYFIVGSIVEPVRFYYDSKLDSYVKIFVENGKPTKELVEQLRIVQKNEDDLVFVSDIVSTDQSVYYNSSIILTLTWEESTQHYIFKDRVSISHIE